MIEFSPTPKPRIRYRWGGASEGHAKALTAFGLAFEVEFVPDSPDVAAQASPLLLIGDCDKKTLRSGSPRRTLVFSEESAADGEELEAIEICGEIPGAPWLRQRRLKLPRGTRISPLPLSYGSEIMARVKSGPVWVRDREGESITDRVAFSLAFTTPAPGRPVLEIVTAETFPLLLPLIQFAREVTGQHCWESGLKACFMFDDPNLHSSTYGFIRFAQVAAEAHERGYHVSFATVPRDAWFVSAKAAALFRGERDFISLLIHGNDHIREELNQDLSEPERLGMLGQALHRIERLEKQTGLEVCRVMAPPHGLCRDRVMLGMARLGFEAACISNGSMRVGDPETDWPKVVGCRPTEIIENLPIIPRFQIAPDNHQRILLAAYLGQPIIPTGHHQDVAGGLRLLSHLAEQINGLGSVSWRRMSEIARSHYQWQLSGETMTIRPFSRLLKIPIPEGVFRLRVESHPGSHFDVAGYSISSNQRGNFHHFDPAEGVSVSGGTTVWLKPVFGGGIDPNRVLLPRFKFWPLARRLACEVRDRAQPWLKRGETCDHAAS